MADAHQLDDFDIKILIALQENADYSMNELGDLVGLSHTPCWRRIKKLEAEGFIRGKVTLLNPKLLNLSVSVHAYVTIKSHDEASLIAFETAVQEVPEIVECYSTTGEKTICCASSYTALKITKPSSSKLWYTCPMWPLSILPSH